MIADDFETIRENMKKQGLISQEEDKPEESIPCDSDSQPDWTDFYNPDFSKSEAKTPPLYPTPGPSEWVVWVDETTTPETSVNLESVVEHHIENADHSQISHMMHLIAERLVMLELDEDGDSKSQSAVKWSARGDGANPLDEWPDIPE